MKNRNPLLVLLFGILTGGIYSWYWIIKTKDEMNSMGEKIPTAWIWFIPIIGTIWWYWEYAKGVDHVTKKEISTILGLLALFILGPLGEAIIQEAFNRVQTPIPPTPEQVIAPEPVISPPTESPIPPATV